MRLFLSKLWRLFYKLWGFLCYLFPSRHTGTPLYAPKHNNEPH